MNGVEESEVVLSAGVVVPRKMSKVARLTGELHQPAGSWISPLSVERMARLLAGSPPQVRAVVAPADVLPAGSTAPVHAEQLALLPSTSVDSVSTSFVAGAVYARSGVTVAIGQHGVDVDLAGGLMLVDHGTYLHEPRRSPRTPVEVASVLAAAPFRWRPDVAFVLIEDPLHTIVHLSALADALIEKSIDARLLVGPSVGIRATNGGPTTRLVQPALAVEATLDVLSPDVLVPLDSAAAALCTRWIVGRRDVVLAADPERLVLRSSGAVANHVQRWASGPHPLDAAQVASLASSRVMIRPVSARRNEPDTALDPGVEVEGEADAEGEVEGEAAPRVRAVSGRRPVRRRTVALLVGPPTSSTVRRVDGLAAILAASGDALTIVERQDVLSRLAELVAADVVVVSGDLSAGRDRELRELGARRQVGGRPTVIDLAPSTAGADDVLTSDRSASMVHASWTTRPGFAGTDPKSSIEVPIAIPIDRQAAIAEAVADRDPARIDRSWASPRGDASAPSFGWWLDPALLDHELEPGQGFVQGLAEGLAERLAGHPDRRLFVMCDPRVLPPVLSRLPNTIALPLGPVAPAVLVQWSVQLITSRSGHDVSAVAAVIEAGLAGVPVLSGAGLASAIPFPLAADAVFAEGPDGAGTAVWFDAIDRLTNDGSARQVAGRSIGRLAHAACGPAAVADEAARFYARVGEPVANGSGPGHAP